MFINKVTESNPFLVTVGVGSISDIQIMFLHFSELFEVTITSNENWKILSKVCELLRKHEIYLKLILFMNKVIEINPLCTMF